MLKRSIIIFMAVLFNTSTYAQAGYQETIRQYVVEKLRFFYVDNPGNANPNSIGPMEIDKVAISEGRNITHPIWDNASNVGLKAMLKSLLCDSVHGGDLLLQGRVANVLLITDKKVLVFLYNDIPNIKRSDAWHDKHPYCESTGYEATHNNASWPCAICYRTENPTTTGEIGMGAYFFNASRPSSSGGWSSPNDKMHVFIHELVHTQIGYTKEAAMGSISNYGTGGHSADELIPSKNSAFNEGIATAFAMRYHKIANWNMSNWYTTNISVEVDNLSGCGTSGTPAAHCLQTRLSNATVQPIPNCGGTTQQCYAIRNVPEDIIMHNENMYAHVLHEYMDQFRSEMLLVRNIKVARTEMFTAPFTFLPLFKEMVKSTKRYTNPTAPAGSTTRGHLLTMSILDYYTGYKMENLGTLSRIIYTDYRNLPDQQNYFDYFSPTARQELLRYRNASGANVWDVNAQLNRFATFLNVR